MLSNCSYQITIRLFIIFADNPKHTNTIQHFLLPFKARFNQILIKLTKLLLLNRQIILQIEAIKNNIAIDSFFDNLILIKFRLP